MKTILAVLCMLASSTVAAQSSRDYFNELYKAGGLDRMADEYVCFDNDPKLDTFFIFGKSETLKQFLSTQEVLVSFPKRGR